MMMGKRDLILIRRLDACEVWRMPGPVFYSVDFSMRIRQALNLG